MEQNRITNSTKDLYQGVRNITKKFQPSNDTVKKEDGTMLCDGEDIKKRWKEYCSKLYVKRNNDNTICHASPQSSVEPEPLLSKVRKAIQSPKLGKSSGIDDRTAELIKNAGENAEIFYHKLIVKIWCEKIWPEDWRKSVFIPIPKSGDTQQCSNNRTIALISHSSKILLKIIADRMKMKLRTEIAEEQNRTGWF